MTVRDLIAQLLRCPMDSTVVLRTAYSPITEAADVWFYSDKAVIDTEQEKSDTPASPGVFEYAPSPVKRSADVMDRMIGAVASVMHKAPEACAEPGCSALADEDCTGYCVEHNPFAAGADDVFGDDPEIIAAKAATTSRSQYRAMVRRRQIEEQSRDLRERRTVAA